MSEEESAEAEIQIGSDLQTSPLADMLSELHEVYAELEVAGFPSRARSEIIAHMIADAILYRAGYSEGETSDEDDLEDDDDDGDPV
jgi:hypothetical protein